MGLGSSLKKAVGLSGSSLSFPKPTEAERKLQEQQLAFTQKFQPIFGDLVQRSLSGEVPVSPALEEELKQREQLTLEDIRRRGGVGAEATTTAGIQRLGRFQTGADIAREQARGQAFQQGLTGLGLTTGVTGQALSRLQQGRAQQFQAMQSQQQEGGGLGKLLGGAAIGAITGGAGLLAGGGIGALGGAGLGALGGLPLAAQLGGGAGVIPQQGTTIRTGGSLSTQRPFVPGIGTF